MTSLLVIGECMMELSAQDDLYYARAFAGDTYNAAVYAKRWCPELEVSYLSAVGTDAISDTMLEQWLTEDIDCSLVVRSEDAPPGIYTIATDADGERSFVYWRDHSAATQIMQLLRACGGAKIIPNFDYVYFSGICLAILSDEDKGSLLDLVQSLRNCGANVGRHI